MQNNTPIEHPDIGERFLKLQAEYRSNHVMLPTEWPMHTVKGRESYRQSQARERFLAEHGLKDAIARAMAKLETMPMGQKIDFNTLIYGQVQ